MRKARLREVEATCKISQNPRWVGLLFWTQNFHYLILRIFCCIISRSLEGVWFNPFLVLMSELSPQEFLLIIYLQTGNSRAGQGQVLPALKPHIFLRPSTPITALLSPSLSWYLSSTPSCLCLLGPSTACLWKAQDPWYPKHGGSESQVNPSHLSHLAPQHLWTSLWFSESFVG